MHTKKNSLRNPLDTQLAEKLLYLFLTSLSFRIEKKKTTSLLKDHFEGLSNEYECIDITLKLTTQGEYLKYPAEGGCPTVYYQYVKEINFSSENKKAVADIQKKFKAFLEKNKELPKNFVSAIHFNYTEEWEIQRSLRIAHLFFIWDAIKARIFLRVFMTSKL